MRSILPIALVCLTVGTSAQETVQGFTIEGHFDAFTTDEMGNVYALRGDELALFDARGRSWLRNSVKTFGKIHTIDAFYSLKPMLFAAEQGQIAVLDNTLSLQGSVINLPRDGFPQVVLACASVQNSFWLFDQRELSLIRVDGQLRPLANTGRLDQVVGISPKPMGMTEHESRLYVNDVAEGILVFDVFGTYMRTIPILAAESFEVRGDALFFFRKGAFGVYDMRSFDVLDIPLPEELKGKVLDARAERGRMYLLLEDRIVVSGIPRMP